MLSTGTRAPHRRDGPSGRRRRDLLSFLRQEDVSDSCAACGGSRIPPETAGLPGALRRALPPMSSSWKAPPWTKTPCRCCVRSPRWQALGPGGKAGFRRRRGRAAPGADVEARVQAALSAGRCGGGYSRGCSATPVNACAPAKTCAMTALGSSAGCGPSSANSAAICMNAASCRTERHFLPGDRRNFWVRPRYATCTNLRGWCPCAGRNTTSMRDGRSRPTGSKRGALSTTGTLRRREQPKGRN